MRHFIVAMCLVLMASTTAPAAQTNSTVRAALSKELPSINLSNVSFGDAMDFMRDITGLNINVQWKELELLHITRETPVNLRLRQVSTRKALELILAEAGATVPLSWYVDQGVLEITTRESADKRMITRVYDVGDLLLEIPDFEGPSFNLSSSNGSGGSGGRGSGGSGGARSGGGGGGLFTGNSGNSSRDEKDKTRGERGDELVKLITTTVRPEVWADAGGTATIAFFRTSLVITAPRSVHEMIGGSFD